MHAALGRNGPPSPPFPHAPPFADHAEAAPPRGAPSSSSTSPSSSSTRPAPPRRRPRDTIDVGIVFDVGGRGDKSFNDGAYLGAERAEKELGARVRFIEPGEGSDREAGLRLLAAEGMDLVIGVGFIFTDDLTQLAKEYPERQASPASTTPSPPTRPGNADPAARQPRRAQVPRGAGLVPRRRARRARRQVEEGRLRRRHGHPAHPQVRGGLRAGVKHVCPDCTVHRAVRRRHARSVPQSRARARSSRSASTSRA